MEPSSGQGRPPRSARAEKPRQPPLSTRLKTPAEYQRVYNAAAARGMCPSAWLRRVALEAARRPLR